VTNSRSSDSWPESEAISAYREIISAIAEEGDLRNRGLLRMTSCHAKVAFNAWLIGLWALCA